MFHVLHEIQKFWHFWQKFAEICIKIIKMALKLWQVLVVKQYCATGGEKV